jgi:hypothetical protein
MNEDNIYFIDTPIEIQDECYYKLLEYLEEINFDKKSNIYLKLSSSINLPGKYFFSVYIQDSFDINLEPDFLIFLQ